MPVTFSFNYKEVFTIETVNKIEELIEDSYDLDDILQFIDEHGENDFCSYYEEYVRMGESIGYNAVDALIEATGDLSYMVGCDEKYRGEYKSTADFAEQFCNEMGYEVPDFIVVDWEATWNCNLRYDYIECEKGYNEVHIFLND